MLAVKYRPTNTQNFVGNQTVIPTFFQWLREWSSENLSQKCCLVSGFSGTGKSILVDLVLQEADYNPIYLSVDDDRSKSSMDIRIQPVLRAKETVDGRKNVFVVSDIDSSTEHGLIGNLVSYVKQSLVPMICICGNRFDQKIQPLLSFCFHIPLAKPAYPDVYKFIHSVVIAEHLTIPPAHIKQLYEQSNGDIRFMLNSLQIPGNVEKKDVQSSNVFETTEQLLSMKHRMEKKMEIYRLANDMHMLMVQENYIANTLRGDNVTEVLENLSYAADALSDSGVLETSVNAGKFELEPYVASSVIRATYKCNTKAPIKFPAFLGKMSTMNKNKKEKLNYENAVFSNPVKKSTTAKTKKPTTKTAAETSTNDSSAPKKRGRPKKTSV